jgi:hypothetical protein
VWPWQSLPAPPCPTISHDHVNASMIDVVPEIALTAIQRSLSLGQLVTALSLHQSRQLCIGLTLCYL